MQPLSALVADVLGQLKLAEQLRPEDCQLLLRGKPLDLSTPLRFANIGRDKLELRTGAALHRDRGWRPAPVRSAGGSNGCGKVDSAKLASRIDTPELCAGAPKPSLSRTLLLQAVSRCWGYKTLLSLHRQLSPRSLQQRRQPRSLLHKLPLPLCKGLTPRQHLPHTRHPAPARLLFMQHSRQQLQHKQPQ